MDFKSWKQACNRLVVGNIGMSIDCMPDALWRDYYEDGMTPQQAIECALEDSWYDEPFIKELFV